MTTEASFVLDECQRSGVTLSINAKGGLSAKGSDQDLSRLLPVIKQHKPELIRALATKKANDPESLAREIAGACESSP